MEVNLVSYGGLAETAGGLVSTGAVVTLKVDSYLILSRDPVGSLEAATKQYVDNELQNLNASNFVTGTISPSRLPAFTGDLFNIAGTNIFNLNSGVISPSTYTKVTVNSKGLITSGNTLVENDIPNLSFTKITTGLPTTLSGYGITDGLSKNGGTLLGPISIASLPTLNSELVNKAYVDNVASTLNELNPGDIIAKTTTSAPAGFLRCNGALVSQATYSALYSVIGDYYTLEKIGTSVGAGKPWKQQYDINSLQFSDITSWTEETVLPGILSNSQAIVTKNRVYLLGGINVLGVTDTVYTASISTTGTVGAWTTVTPLPTVLSDSQAVTIKNKVYLIGGHNGSTAVTTIYSADINTDGTLGTWVTESPLPVPISNSQVVVTKNMIHVLGGENSSGTLSTVYSASIDFNGVIGQWNISNPLPGPVTKAQSIVTRNKLYLIGGRNTTDLNSIYSVPINYDGTLGLWSIDPISLPVGLSSSQVAVTDNEVYLIGGMSGTWTSSVYRATIQPDGTIGTWVISTPLTITRYNFSLFITASNIYLVGGHTSSSTIVDNVTSGSFTGGSNDYSQYYSPSIVVIYPGQFMLPDTSLIDSQELKYHYVKF